MTVRRADAAAGVGRELPPGMVAQDQDRLGQAGPGAQQGLELAALLELVESPQGGHDALPGAAALVGVGLYAALYQRTPQNAVDSGSKPLAERRRR